MPPEHIHPLNAKRHNPRPLVLHEQLYHRVSEDTAKMYISSPGTGIEIPGMTLSIYDDQGKVVGYERHGPATFIGEEFEWSKNGRAVHAKGRLALNSLNVKIAMNVRVPGKLRKILGVITRSSPRASISATVSEDLDVVEQTTTSPES